MNAVSDFCLFIRIFPIVGIMCQANVGQKFHESSYQLSFSKALVTARGLADAYYIPL